METGKLFADRDSLLSILAGGNALSMAILVIEACRTAAETMVHGRVKVLDLAFFIGKEQQELWKRDGRSADFFFFF